MDIKMLFKALGSYTYKVYTLVYYFVNLTVLVITWKLELMNY